MTEQEMAKVLNEWQRKYIENPEEFKAEFRTVIEYLAELNIGRVPSYGEECAAYMVKLLSEI